MDKEQKLRAAVTELRSRLDLSQQEFSDRIGKVRDMVYRYEKNRAPSGDALAALALLARKEQQEDLEKLFTQALIEDLPDVAKVFLERGAYESPRFTDKTLAFESAEIDNTKLSGETRRAIALLILACESGNEKVAKIARDGVEVAYELLGREAEHVAPVNIYPIHGVREEPGAHREDAPPHRGPGPKSRH